MIKLIIIINIISSQVSVCSVTFHLLYYMCYECKLFSWVTNIRGSRQKYQGSPFLKDLIHSIYSLLPSWEQYKLPCMSAIQYDPCITFDLFSTVKNESWAQNQKNKPCTNEVFQSKTFSTTYSPSIYPLFSASPSTLSPTLFHFSLPNISSIILACLFILPQTFTNYIFLHYIYIW